MSRAEAQARYAAKRPRFNYSSDLDIVEDLKALRDLFDTDQEMMSYLVRLGLEEHRIQLASKTKIKVKTGV
jgi:hypothetical protein